MNNIKITAKKELRSILRDHKTLIILFTVPIFIPFIIFFYGFMFDSTENKTEDIDMIGINYQMDQEAQKIVENNKIKTVYNQSENELKKDFKDKKITAYIIYKEKENKYYINCNEATQSGQIVESKIISYLESYNQTLALTYINDHKLDPTKIYNNVNYEIVKTDDNNLMLTTLISIALTYTIMAITITGSNMATSATVSEKENGTLETILTLPIKTNELILGKHLAATIMGFIVSLFSLILTALTISISSKVFKSFASFKITFSFTSIIYSLITILAASILISGLAIALTALCKTNKEAQSKVQILNFLSLIPMFVSLLEVELSKFYYLIPICNYIQVLMDIFDNKANIVNILIVFLSSIFYIFIIIRAIIAQYKSEKVLFAN